jgi:hypothetical protein
MRSLVQYLLKNIKISKNNAFNLLRARNIRDRDPILGNCIFCLKYIQIKHTIIFLHVQTFIQLLKRLYITK